MLPKSLLLAITLLIPVEFQDDIMKHIVRKHDNGNPYVVIYTQGPLNERVMEELYYENGQLDYRGHYKKGREHGSWIYYWPNGKLKSQEYYEKGLEEGVMYDYNEQGQKIKEYRYVKGTLMKETVLNPDD